MQFFRSSSTFISLVKTKILKHMQNCHYILFLFSHLIGKLNKNIFSFKVNDKISLRIFGFNAQLIYSLYVLCGKKNSDSKWIEKFTVKINGIQNNCFKQMKIFRCKWFEFVRMHVCMQKPLWILHHKWLFFFSSSSLLQIRFRFFLTYSLPFAFR